MKYDEDWELIFNLSNVEVTGCLDNSNFSKIITKISLEWVQDRRGHSPQ